MNNKLLSCGDYLSEQKFAVYRLLDSNGSIWAATDCGWLKMSNHAYKQEETVQKIRAIKKFQSFGLAPQIIFRTTEDKNGYLMECYEKMQSVEEFDCADSFAVKRIAQLMVDLLYVGMQALHNWEDNSSEINENIADKTVGHGNLQLSSFFWNKRDYIIIDWENVRVQNKFDDLKSLLNDSGWTAESHRVFIEEYLKWAPISELEKAELSKIFENGDSLKSSKKAIFNDENEQIEDFSEKKDKIAVWKGFI